MSDKTPSTDTPTMSAPDASMSMAKSSKKTQQPKIAKASASTGTTDVSDQAPGVASMPPAQPKKPMSKGLLWGLVGGGIAFVVLIIVVIVAVLLFGGPSKSDYSKAARLVSQIRSDASASSISLSDNTPEEINSKLKEIDEKNQELEKSRVMRDSEAKVIYDEYKSEYQELKPILSNLPEIAEAYKDTRSSCSGSASTSITLYNRTGDEVGSQFDKNYAACTNVLKKQANSSVSVVKEYASSYLDYLSDMRSYLVARANKDYSVSYPRLSSVSNPITAVATKISNNKTNTKLRELYNYLEKKSLGSQ